MTAATGTWLRRFQPTADAPTRLVCLPHAGGSATWFAPLARRHAPHLDVLAAQYPARQDRRGEPPVPSITGLAAGVVADLLPLADRPIALFGHSMGATVAYEAARLLRGHGVTPVALFASSRRPPATHRGEVLHTKPDADLLRELDALGGTDLRLLDRELLDLALAALRVDYQAVEDYEHVPGEPLTCPVTALVGDADPKVTPEEAAGWAACTTGPFTREVFPGGHFFLTGHVDAVDALITSRLAAAPR